MPDGKLAGIHAENDGTVVLVDTVKHKMIKAIMLGKPGVIKPMNVLFSPDASRLYVSTGRGTQLFTINTADNSVVSSVEVGQRPSRPTAKPSSPPMVHLTGL
jgi:DNA-binding beta-propeller fold protein YncE